MAADADAIRVETTGNQFVWNFRYPGPDGKFGRLDRNRSAPPREIRWDWIPEDPAGKTTLWFRRLTVPVNHQVELLLRSQDVIHSFFVRELRLKQDAMPGMVIPMHVHGHEDRAV